jgi:adenylyltransferase/sulfurtransferase
VTDVNSTNIEGIIKGAGLVLDGTDNLATRFLINDACIKNKITWIYGSCVKSEGAAAVFYPNGPCFRCVFPKMPGKLETCDTVGIVSSLPSAIASMQVAETIKVLTGKNKTALIFYDSWKQAFDKIEVKKRKDCKACSKHNYEFLNSKNKGAMAICGRDIIQVNPTSKLKISELLKRLQKSEVEIVGGNLYLLIFKVGDFAITVFEDGRALIKGTSDEKIAKSLYSRYVGA